MDDILEQQTVPEYNTRAVENLTGVPADTFRAWERRHGLPQPARTPGNHRLYSERDIAIVSWLKQMTDQGVSISHAVSMARRRLEVIDNGERNSVIDVAPPEPYGAPGNNGSGQKTLEQCLLDAFLAFDAQRANQILEEALTIHDVETVCLDILQPALIDVGLKWERGEACMAVEHFATSFCMRKLSGLFNASQPEVGNPTIIMSGVAGEMHEVGLLITALILSRSGFRVVYLGSNLPGCELVEAVRSVRPEAVVFSAPTRTAVETLRETIDNLRAQIDANCDPLIGYGGAIFEHERELRDTVQATYLGKDARHAREQLQGALSARAQEMMLARS